MEVMDLKSLSDVLYKGNTPEGIRRIEVQEYLDMCHYIADLIERSPKKDNTQAENYRNLGNNEYTKKRFADSLRFYTKSLHFATFHGMDYGKALANRSAATFALQEYKECLKDIEACLASDYPQELRSKLLLRRLQAYYHLNLDEEFYMEVEEMWERFKDNEVFIKLRNSFKGNLLIPMYKTNKSYPKVTMNATFAFATDFIELKYNDKKGRHVIARKDIKMGDILFQEKAFIAAQIFISEKELKPGFCYQCLKKIPYFSIPCPSCTYCLYCSEKCKKISWIQGHRFECQCMIIFHEYGHALPAFKMFMKGIQSLHVKKDMCGLEFGGRVDNSPWANSLMIGVSQAVGFLQRFYSIAKVLTTYLHEKTDFYEYLDRHMEKYDRSFVEESLVANMMKLNSNGSAIEDEECETIAGGLYPSISMMNHSCKCNITIDYDGVIAVVKAKEDIAKGEEVFNCYGVDYKSDRKTRRHYLKDTYNFDCFCPYCAIEKADE